MHPRRQSCIVTNLALDRGKAQPPGGCGCKSGTWRNLRLGCEGSTMAAPWHTDGAGLDPGPFSLSSGGESRSFTATLGQQLDPEG